MRILQRGYCRAASVRLLTVKEAFWGVMSSSLRYHRNSTILRVLACVEEYRFYDSNDLQTIIAFRVLSAMLLSFTELYAEIYKYAGLMLLWLISLLRC